MSDFNISQLTDEQALELSLRAEQYKQKVKTDALHDAELAKWRAEQAAEKAAQQKADQKASRDAKSAAILAGRVPETYAAWQNLPHARMVELLQIFGETLTVEIRRKEAAQMSWPDWYRMSIDLENAKALKDSAKQPAQGEVYAELRSDAEIKASKDAQTLAESFSDEQYQAALKAAGVSE